MAEQFDLSEDQRKLYLERAKRRLALRNEFLKQKLNPFSHGEGGVVFDPAIQRYQALKVNGFEYFKPSPKNAIQTLGLVLIPMIAFGYFLNMHRTGREAKYRAGLVAYKDRHFKLI